MSHDLSTELSPLLRPLECLNTLSLTLNGTSGNNRNPDGSYLIDADTDFEAIIAWLKRYDTSPQTLRSYRKEIERLYVWCLQALNKPFSSLTVEDIQLYLLFIQSPQPFDLWCGPRRARSDKRWKPFEGPLSEASRKQALTIVSTCFAFLVECGYLRANPVRLLSKSSKPKPYQSASVERYLDKETWQLFWKNLFNQPQNTEKEKKHYERNLFIFSLLYLQSPRANEVVSHRMNSIIKIHGKWWWQITGKGRKVAQIPWKDEMMEALVRYRKHRHLSLYPSIEDQAPLLASLSGNHPITRDMLYKTVKSTVRKISNEIRSLAPEQAQKIELSSTHWFRHTSLTHQANDGTELRYLQAMARHESMDTTQRYLHIESDKFHTAINK